jgi:hypothetical protein
MVSATLRRKFSLRAEYLHDDQMSNPAMRTERWRGRDFGGRQWKVGRGGVGVGRNVRFHQGSRLLTGRVLAGTGQSVVAHFGKTRREDMLHKTANEFLGMDSHVLQLLRPVVAITKGNVAVSKGLIATRKA